MIYVSNCSCPFTFTNLIYVAATEMTRSDVILCSWNSPAPSAGNTGLLCLQICVRQTVRLTIEFADWCRNVCTLYKHLSATPAAVTSDLKQRIIDTWASISQNLIDKAVGQWRKRLRASMKGKRRHFEHLLN